jgi:hypothetical protein
MPCGRSSVAVPLATPPFPDDAADWVPAEDVAERERVAVAFLGTDRERPAPPDARVPVDRLDDDDPPDLEAELLVVLFFPVLLLAELFLLVLFLPVLRLELVFAVFLFAGLLFAVPLVELLFAGLLFAVPLVELLLAELFLLVLFLLVLFLPVLRLELLFVVLFRPVLLELLLAVFLLELLLAVLLLPVLLAPERFFAPLRFRDEPPRPPFDSASMSSSFRIREAPAIPARVARLRSSVTVMSSMLRATSAPSPIVPLTCAVATPVRPPLITPPSTAPPDARGRGLAPCSRSPSASAWSRLHREGIARRRVRGADRRGRGSGGAAFGHRSRGNEPLVADGAPDRGELAEEKRGESSDAGRPQPSAAEVESARLLENAAAERLGAEGVRRDEVRRLADEYVALDLGEDTDEFVRWVRNRLGR